MGFERLAATLLCVMVYTCAFAAILLLVVAFTWSVYTIGKTILRLLHVEA